jgi:hypothetical protein
VFVSPNTIHRIEGTCRYYRQGLRILEVFFISEDRRGGQSKMGRCIVTEDSLMAMARRLRFDRSRHGRTLLWTGTSIAAQ